MNKTGQGVAGFILEIGASAPPFVFEDHDGLMAAWANHHALYGVPPTEVEMEDLNLSDFWNDEGFGA